MSMTFTKLFSSITASTIWAAPDHTRIVWVTMLAMADQHGRVWASIPGLANIARVSIDRCEAALAELLSTDKYSRTKDNEGRRIEAIDGGWRLLNHAKYRAIRDEESIKESKRRYINARRAKEREAVEPCRTESNSVDRGRANTEADTEAEANKTPRASRSAFFSEFWRVWPQSKRKGGKAECEKVWAAKGLDAKQAEIVAHVEAMARSEDWQKAGGKFIPAPLTYLRGQRWDGADLGESAGQSDAFAGAI